MSASSGGFPKGFVWGAASSAYQIEGAASEDGRGPSVWDDWSRTPGNVWLNQTGDIACDHYHRYREDVGLMSKIGLQAYRFSISWSRVLPDGTPTSSSGGGINQRGLDFYDRLVDSLLAANIRPYVTLFHWDYPTALYHRGGWLNRDSASWLADYSAIVAKRLGDRVRDWMTINEPQCFLKFGHGDGANAPGLKLPLREQLLACHHTLLGHGLSVRAIRDSAPTNSKHGPTRIGWAPVCVTYSPESDSPADIEAARAMTNGVPTRDLWNNAWYNDPVFFGQYPEEGLKQYGADVPTIRDGDMETIAQPMDFLGINIYFGQLVRAGKPDGNGKPAPPQIADRPVGHGLTALRWPLDPPSLRWGPRFMAERYKVPVYITENGLSSMDWPDLEGRIRDTHRVDYTRRYLMALRQAIEGGADIRGYFHWSVMDNFEWPQGYKERFGLIYVDYPTQQRTLKDSAAWYRRVIQTNGAAIDESPRFS